MFKVLGIDFPTKINGVNNKVTVSMEFERPNRSTLRFTDVRGYIRYKTIKNDKIPEKIAMGRKIIYKPNTQNDTNMYVTVIERKDKRRLRGMVNNVTYKILPFPIVEKSITYISDWIYKKIIEERQPYINLFPQGFRYYVRLVYNAILQDGEGKLINDYNYASEAFVVEKKITSSMIYNKLYKKSIKTYNTYGYMIFLNMIDFHISPLPNDGGCNEKNNSMQKIIINKKENIKLYSYKSKNNNCLFACLNNGFNIKGNVIKPDHIRNKLNIELNTKINIEQIDDIVKYYNNEFNKDFGYILLNENHNIIKMNSKDYNIQLNFFVLLKIKNKKKNPPTPQNR